MYYCALQLVTVLPLKHLKNTGKDQIISRKNAEKMYINQWEGPT